MAVVCCSLIDLFELGSLILFGYNRPWPVVSLALKRVLPDRHRYNAKAKLAERFVPTWAKVRDQP